MFEILYLRDLSEGHHVHIYYLLLPGVSNFVYVFHEVWNHNYEFI